MPDHPAADEVEGAGIAATDHLERDAPVTDDYAALALHREALAVGKRVRKTLVRAARTTSSRSVVVDEELASEQVVVERVPIGRIVETIPPVREEGDITIISLVREEVVVVRRLVLTEEVHLRRVRTTERHTEAVTLREQQLTVTRTPIPD